jgi:hypothetical protein
MQMNEKKMYVITMSTGSYDSYSQSLVAVTDDFEKGSAYVNKMNTTYESVKNKMDVFYKDVYPVWNVENPRPQRMDFTPVPVPKWKGNEKITQAMRDERKAIEEANRLLAQKANEPWLLWGKMHKEFIEQWVKDNMTDEEQEIQQHMDDNCWEIEETPWLK